MRHAILIMILAAPAMAAGPLFTHKDKFIDQEFENVYHDIASGGGTTSDPLSVSTVTAASISVSTITASSATITTARINTLSVGSLSGVTFGKLVHFEEDTDSSQRSTTSTSFADSGLSITRACAKSTDLLFFVINALFTGVTGGAGAATCRIEITKDGSGVLSSRIVYFLNPGLSGHSSGGRIVQTTKVACSDTASHTYVVRYALQGAAGSCWMNSDTANTSEGLLTLLEIDN